MLAPGSLTLTSGVALATGQASGQRPWVTQRSIERGRLLDANGFRGTTAISNRTPSRRETAPFSLPHTAGIIKEAAMTAQSLLRSSVRWSSAGVGLAATTYAGVCRLDVVTLWPPVPPPRPRHRTNCSTASCRSTTSSNAITFPSTRLLHSHWLSRENRPVELTDHPGRLQGTRIDPPRHS